MHQNLPDCCILLHTRMTQMDFLPPHSVALSQKCSSLPICYCRYFWALLFLLICFSWFLLPSIFSSSLHSKHRAENAGINHFEASVCGWAQPVSTSSLWFVSAPWADWCAGLWPEELEPALLKVPGAPARGTEHSLVPVVHLQLQHNNLKPATEGQEERMHPTNSASLTPSLLPDTVRTVLNEQG